jgi:hypothetical protein
MVDNHTAFIKTALDKTEALIIGAGAGLSAVTSLDYNNADTFNTLFPGYHARYDYREMFDFMGQV